MFYKKQIAKIQERKVQSEMIFCRRSSTSAERELNVGNDGFQPSCSNNRKSVLACVFWKKTMTKARRKKMTNNGAQNYSPLKRIFLVTEIPKL